MRLRKTVFVLAALLFCHLAVAFLSRAQLVYAQSFSPITGVDLIDYVVQPGEYLNAGFAIAHFPCNDENNDGKCNYQDKFTSVRYRFDVLHRAGQTDADNCEGQGLNRDRTYAPASYDSWRSLGPIPLRITRSCQPGPYTLRLSVTYFDPATDQSHTLTDTVDFDVGEPSPPTPTPNPTPGNGQNGNGQGGNGQGGNGQNGNGQDGDGQNGNGQGGNGQNGNGQGGNGQDGNGQDGNGQNGNGQGGNGQNGNGQNGNGQDGNGQNGNGQNGNGQNGNGQNGNGQNGGQDGNGQGGQTSRDTQTPETEPSTKPPEPTQEPPPPQGPVAITQPDHTNVRLGPATVYKIVRSVPNGTRAQIICIGPRADWYEVKIEGIYGTVWIKRDLTVLVGSLDGVCRYRAGAFTVQAWTWPVISHLRVGPGTNYDVITTVPQGTHVKIIGLGPEDKWFLIELSALEGPAWIHQSLVELSGSVRGYRQLAPRELVQMLRPGPNPAARPYLITQPEILNVRLGPGLNYDVITTVPRGTQAAIYGMDPDKKWFQVELEGLDTLAWVYRDLTRVVGSLVNVRRITPREIAALPALIIQPRNVNARLGPGAAYEAEVILPKGTWARITGIDPQEEWFRIKVVGLKTPLWVARYRTKVAGGLLGRFRPHAAENAMHPESGPNSDRPLAIAQSESMKVRTGPGLEYKVITTVPQGVSGEIYGIDPTKNWFQVQIEGLDTLAWVLRDMTWVDGLLVSVRLITPREIAAWPALITQPPTLLTRSGPGKDYPAVARLPKGSWVRTVGIGPHAEWFLIEVDFPGIDPPVWIARRHAKIAAGSLADIPRKMPEDSPPSSAT